jgi:hypothetical protein
MIIYNEGYFTELFQKQVDFAPLKGKWLFVEYLEGTGKFISPQDFTLNETSFNIQSFYEVLQAAEAKWSKLMPFVPFPDVQISADSDQSAYLSYDKTNRRHIIFLSLKDLASLDKFKFTIGHELGHLYYLFSGMQEKVNARLKHKQFKEFIPWPMVLLGSFCIGLNLFVIYQNELWLVNLFALMQILGWGSYLAANILSRKRLENYSMEFFSDFFSVVFMGKPHHVDCGLTSGGWNGYTHPAGNWRLNIIRSMPTQCLVSQWDNPVERFSYKFKFINFYEMQFTLSVWWHSFYLPLKAKVLTLFKK